ncbi:MAG: cytochrome C [Actinobacteria bacterium]|nr:MAG: cytochrome C [Actinomycetota bacterium]
MGARPSPEEARRPGVPTWTFPLLLAGTVAVVVALAGLGPGRGASAGAEPRVPAAGVAAGAAPDVAAAPSGFDARSTYLGDCAICHGVDGRGTSRAKAIADRGAADVDYALSTGRMPLPPLAERHVRIVRHPPRYSPPEVAALVAYVSGLGGGSGVPIPHVDLTHTDLAQGGELFRGQCAACHAWAGNGGALLNREAPSLHRSTPTQIAEAVRVGPGTMPAFGEAAFTDDDLNSLVAYARYLDHPRDRGGNALWHLGPLPEGMVAWVFGIGLLLLTLLWIGESAHSQPHTWRDP